MQDPGTISLYRRVLRGRLGWGFWRAVKDGTSGREVGVLDSTWKGWEFGQAAKNGTSGGEAGAGRQNSAWRPERGREGKELRVCQDGSRLIQDGQRAYQANTCKSHT